MRRTAGVMLLISLGLGVLSCGPEQGETGSGAAAAGSGAAATGSGAAATGSGPAAVSVAGPGGASCDLPQTFVHQVRRGTETVHFAPGIVAFRTPYAVNTDGAPNSYHPEDPRGSRGLAINTICNGASAVTASGATVDYRQCDRLVDLFEAARDAGWPTSGAHMRFYGVASSNGGATPCVQESGQYAGFFVSSTAVEDPSFGICEQRRYLDALNVPFIILPGSSDFAARGMGTRDLAVVYNPATGRMVFAMVGDKGPAHGLGEGSVALNRTLAGRTDWPSTRRDTYAFALRDATTVVFTDASIGPPYTNERIAAAGEAALARFGGAERLAACSEEMR